MAGDAISNYRTVASFAHEEKVVNDFSIMLENPKKLAISNAHKIGIIYGFSQFLIYGMISVLFYAGAQFLKHYEESPLYMFVSIFAMNFGALASGQAN